MLEWALRYIKLGWPVFPLTPRGKVPLISKEQGGRGCLDAVLNEAQVRTWWTRWPNANIGIATGHKFFVVDIDTRKGGDESWFMLHRQYVKLPDTIEQVTGTGGKHILYRTPDFEVHNSEGRLAEGVDVRGVHGYIVAPPSIHPETKREYYWDGWALDVDELDNSKIAAAPVWLLRKIQELDRRKPTADKVPDKIPKGRQHSTLVSIAGTMRARGLSPDEIFAALQVVNRDRCQEPGPVENIRRIADSMAKYAPNPGANAFSQPPSAPAPAREIFSEEVPLSQPDIEAAVQAAIEQSDLNAAGHLAAPIARLRRDVQAVLAAKLRKHFGEQFPIDGFEAAMVEADVRLACERDDLNEAVELAPRIGRITEDVRAMLILRLRAHFGDRFPQKLFESAAKAAQGKVLPFKPPGGGGSEPQQSQDGPDLIGPPLTDSGNGERMVAMYGDRIRYCTEMEKWLVWDGKRWAEDNRRYVTQLAKRMARRLHEQAVGAARQDAMEKWARKSESAAGIEATLRRAATEQYLPVSATEFDRHPYLLNCMNGVIDLRSGELLPHNREFMLTKLCPVDYDPLAECPQFLRFVNWAMGDTNPESDPPPRVLPMVAYLQRIFGYALTGDTSAKCVFVLYGPKANNGKTTLVETIAMALGPDYATEISIKTLMHQRGNEAGSDLADLRGARYVTVSEAQEGEAINEALLKYLTAGQGKIKARKLYENFIRFTATHHLFLDCNHRPKVRGADPGIWNRLKLIPFDSVVAESDMDLELKDKLWAERAGILAWAVMGCVQWIKTKRLEEPGEVVGGTKDWRESDDPLREFLEDCCEVEPEAWERSARLSAAYRWWCKQNSERYPLGRSKFAERLRIKGFGENHARRDNENRQMRTWEGIKLKDGIWGQMPVSDRLSGE